MAREEENYNDEYYVPIKIYRVEELLNQIDLDKQKQ